MNKFFKILFLITFGFFFLYPMQVFAEKKIKIGLLIPITGEDKELGQQIIKSTRIALKDLDTSKLEILLKTLGFTYLNAHVYSDTVFFLGNFSKNFLLDEKIFFGIGASIASFIFFFLLGYMSTYFSKYAQNDIIWKFINIFIIAFMLLLIIYIIKETVYLI